ncbi:hypothetical protein QBC40DRAFT_286797 [Triangularia verruculosa]|uniref:Secreted protein n=1 Tax=Triangularia verruculosa TaxID=2587418 RepID=A0AAN7APU4_9PEZI|nr:hypothetical protein QBC40DRAFT_286797 [Triangularia verruculosa]
MMMLLLLLLRGERGEGRDDGGFESVVWKTDDTPKKDCVFDIYIYIYIPLSETWRGMIIVYLQHTSTFFRFQRMGGGFCAFGGWFWQRVRFSPWEHTYLNQGIV